jgi:uncharacterized membrane protein
VDTKLRSLLKALTWQVTGLFVMSVTAYLVTGSWNQATLLSTTSCLLGLAIYLLHERIWQRIPWGRTADRR